jgi:hypothetical protein
LKLAPHFLDKPGVKDVGELISKKPLYGLCIPTSNSQPGITVAKYPDGLNFTIKNQVLQEQRTYPDPDNYFLLKEFYSKERQIYGFISICLSYAAEYTMCLEFDAGWPTLMTAMGGGKRWKDFPLLKHFKDLEEDAEYPMLPHNYALTREADDDFVVNAYCFYVVKISFVSALMQHFSTLPEFVTAVSEAFGATGVQLLKGFNDFVNIEAKIFKFSPDKVRDRGFWTWTTSSGRLMSKNVKVWKPYIEELYGSDIFTDMVDGTKDYNPVRFSKSGSSQVFPNFMSGGGFSMAGSEFMKQCLGEKKVPFINIFKHSCLAFGDMIKDQEYRVKSFTEIIPQFTEAQANVLKQSVPIVLIKSVPQDLLRCTDSTPLGVTGKHANLSIINTWKPGQLETRPLELRQQKWDWLVKAILVPHNGGSATVLGKKHQGIKDADEDADADADADADEAEAEDADADADADEAEAEDADADADEEGSEDEEDEEGSEDEEDEEGSEEEEDEEGSEEEEEEEDQ